MLKLKAVDSIPVLGKRHDLQVLIEEFAKSNCEIMEVEFKMGSDYKNAVVCRSCLANAINRSRRYGIRAIRSGNRVFMVRTD